MNAGEGEGERGREGEEASNPTSDCQPQDPACASAAPPQGPATSDQRPTTGDERSVHAERLLGWLLPLLQSPVITWIIVGNLVLNLGFMLPKCLSGWFVMVDAHVYARAAQNVWRHEPVYPLTPQGDIRTPDNQPMPFLYSPFFAAALGPLGWIDTENIVRIFFVLGFACFWGFAAALAWIVNRKVTWRGVLGAGYVAIMVPGMYFNVMSGQIETLLLLLFVAAMVVALPTGGGPAASGGTSPWTGVLLAVSLLVKPFVAWPLGIMALREPRRVIPSAAATLVVGAGLGALVCGVDSYRQWLHYAPTTMYGLIFGNTNTSLALLPLRALGYGILPSWGRPFLMAMFVIFPGLVAWVMRKRAAAIQASWVGAAALLFAPFSHHYYLPLLLVPMALEVRGLLDAMAGERRLVGCSRISRSS